MCSETWNFRRLLWVDQKDLPLGARIRTDSSTRLQSTLMRKLQEGSRKARYGNRFGGGGGGRENKWLKTGSYLLFSEKSSL